MPAEPRASALKQATYFHGHSVRVAAAVKDQALEAIVFAGNQWLSRTRCREISVLDVMPIPLEKVAGGVASAGLEW